MKVRSSFLTLAGLLALLEAGVVPPAVAQTLDRADSLAQRGRVREARQELTRWWESESSSASRLETQRGLWLRALLASDARQAGQDYRRLTVEYPGGAYSSEAHFRLIQEAASRGDWTTAAAHLDILERDYPNSPRGAEARSWIAARPAGQPREGAAVSAPPTPEARGELALQLGAFGTLAGARALEARARGAGLDVRVVRVLPSELFRVRTGAFLTPQEVAERRAAVVSLGFEVMMVNDVERESPIP
jgi:hypothetical protein